MEAPSEVQNTHIKRGSNNRKSISFSSVAVIILFLGLTAFMTYNIFRTLTLSGQKLQVLEQAEQEVEQLRLDNIKLVMQRNDVITDDYIETQARNRLNYSKKGETQVVIPDTVIEKLKDQSAVMGVNDSNQASVLEKWLEFFTKGL